MNFSKCTPNGPSTLASASLVHIYTHSKNGIPLGRQAWGEFHENEASHFSVKEGFALSDAKKTMALLQFNLLKMIFPVLRLVVGFNQS